VTSQPIFYVVEAFPHAERPFLTDEVWRLIQQGSPVRVIDYYPQYRDYTGLSAEQRTAFDQVTLCLSPGHNAFSRWYNRNKAVLRAWGYGFRHYPMLLRKFQQLSIAYPTGYAFGARRKNNKSLAAQRINRFLSLHYAMQHQTDFVYVYGGDYALDWVTIKEVLGSRIQLIVAFLGEDVTIDAMETPGLYTDLFEVADQFVTHSSYLCDVLIEQGCPPNKLTVIGETNAHGITSDNPPLA
jgi:hypothetical protein